MRILTVIVLVVLMGCGDTAPRRPAAPPRHAVSPCTPTPSEGRPEDSLAAREGTPSRVRLHPGGNVPRTRATIAAGRRGKPLVVHGVVRDEDCAPLPGATVNAWQTTAAGRYGPGQTCCYLQGTVRTDRRGHYALDTVVPGGYRGLPPHIHIEAGHGSTGVLTEVAVDGRPSRIRFDVVLPRQRPGA